CLVGCRRPSLCGCRCGQLRDAHLPLMDYQQQATGFADALARWAADAAAASVLYLVRAITKPTEVIEPGLTHAYSRMLAIALLLVGAVVAFALVERLLGGSHGAGVEIVPRTL